MMTGLLAFSRAIDFINHKFGLLANWLVLAACLISAGNAVVRYLFNYSSNGLLEIQWYMFGGMVFLGASFTLLKNEHVRVDILYGGVSDRFRLWIDAVGFIVFFLPVTILMMWPCWPYFWTSWVGNEVSPNAGGLLVWPVKVLLPLGFALLTLQGVSELIKRAAGLSGVVKIDTKYEKPLQ